MVYISELVFGNEIYNTNLLIKKEDNVMSKQVYISADYAEGGRGDRDVVELLT